MSLEVSKLFVGGLPYDMDEKRLAEVFVQFGTVIHCKIVRCLETGTSRGFGFVEFECSKAATAAFELDGATLDGRVCNVSLARDRPGFGPRGRLRGPSDAVEVRARPDPLGFRSSGFPVPENRESRASRRAQNAAPRRRIERSKFAQ